MENWTNSDHKLTFNKKMKILTLENQNFDNK